MPAARRFQQHRRLAPPSMNSALRHRARPLLLSLLSLPVLLAIGALPRAGAQAQGAVAPLPLHLRDTGLYADASNARWNAPVAAGHVAFAPQYPLWSDGSHKRRWLALPAGTAVDARDPAAWQFPPGTRLWKEFAFDGPVETRLIERLADGSWRYASYVWNADGTDATRAPASGIASLAARGAPGGTYAIPGVDDCKGCHEGAAVPPLGFSALQLSADRDPNALHAEHAGPGLVLADLRSLARAGILRDLPAELLATPPRVDARTPTERAALGYLHANCGHCHHRGAGRVPVGVALAQGWQALRPDSHDALASLGGASRFRLHDHATDRLVAPGRPDDSLVLLRMAETDPRARMPPIGTRVVDAEAVALVKRWIAELQPSHKEPTP
jgi:hypothetical protein